MRIRTALTAALAAVLVVVAPAAAHADPGHSSSLSASVATVSFDGEAFNAGQQASVVVMPVGARYSNPAPGDIVYLNEYTLDAAGTVTFTVVLPGGELDDYVLAVNVAGATARYLESLDPAGPTPVETPTGGGGNGGGSGAGDGLANSGAPIAVGALGATVLALLALGATLVIIRRRPAAGR